MVLIFKEKRAGIAGLSALTRTRLVQTCGERSRGQEWLSRAHISPWRLCGCPGTALKTFQANRKCPMPTLRLMLQHSPSSSSQLEEECEIYTLRAPHSLTERGLMQTGFKQLLFSPLNQQCPPPLSHPSGLWGNTGKAAGDGAQPILNGSNGVYTTPVILNVQMCPVKTQGLCHRKSWSQGSISTGWKHQHCACKTPGVPGILRLLL